MFVWRVDDLNLCFSKPPKHGLHMKRSAYAKVGHSGSLGDVTMFKMHPYLRLGFQKICSDAVLKTLLSSSFRHFLRYLAFRRFNSLDSCWRPWCTPSSPRIPSLCWSPSSRASMRKPSFRAVRGLALSCAPAESERPGLLEMGKGGRHDVTC